MKHFLTKPVHASSLAAFRIFFGFFMAVHLYKYFIGGRIYYQYIEPSFLFTFPPFDYFLPVWSPTFMYVHFAVTLLFSIGICLGFFYRTSIIGFFFCYSYIFLLDQTQYNNHYYLIVLLSFVFIFFPANSWWSLDSIRNPKIKNEYVPNWNVFILQMQIVIVYFYGGIAKMNYDWLAGEPMRHWILNMTEVPYIGWFFTTELAAYFFSYSGLAFDLAVGWLLLYRRTLPYILPFVLFFHFTNSFLFTIGIFPPAMIAFTIIFTAPYWPQQTWNWLRGKSTLIKKPTNAVTKYPRLSCCFVIVFLAIQVLVPFRHFLYPGNPSWTEEGHNFSWHMKLRDKQGSGRIKVTDPATNKSWYVNVLEDINERQAEKMYMRPVMIYQYVQYLKRKLIGLGIENPIIQAEVFISLNYREPRYMIDPKVNLANEEYGLFSCASWITKFDENTPFKKE